MRPLRAAVALLVASLVACGDGGSGSSPDYTYSLQGETMGTTYSVRVDSALRPLAEADLALQIQELLDDINARMSTYVDASEVSMLNAADPADFVAFSDDTFFVLQSAIFLAESADGAFDPTVGALVNAWGFGPVNASTAPSEFEIDTLRSHTGLDKLELNGEERSVRKTDPEARVDLSAIAKGYAVDKVGDLLVELGLTSFMAEIGGEVLVGEAKRDGTPWRIGVEKPDVGAQHLQRTVPLESLAMATSGNYRNFYVMDGRTLGHTIDPRDGQPVDHNGASVTVVHESCMMADGFATTLMVMGPDEGLAWAAANDIAALFVVHDGEGLVERMTPEFERIAAGGAAEEA